MGTFTRLGAAAPCPLRVGAEAGPLILTMHIDNTEEAAAAAKVGMDMFTFEVDDRLEVVRAAAPGMFVQDRLPARTHGL